jgi:hypothetical protein
MKKKKKKKKRGKIADQTIANRVIKQFSLQPTLRHNSNTVPIDGSAIHFAPTHRCCTTAVAHNISLAIVAEKQFFFTFHFTIANGSGIPRCFC